MFGKDTEQGSTSRPGPQVMKQAEMYDPEVLDASNCRLPPYTPSATMDRGRIVLTADLLHRRVCQIIAYADARHGDKLSLQFDGARLRLSCRANGRLYTSTIPCDSPRKSARRFTRTVQATDLIAITRKLVRDQPKSPITLDRRLEGLEVRSGDPSDDHSVMTVVGTDERLRDPTRIRQPQRFRARIKPRRLRVLADACGPNGHILVRLASNDAVAVSPEGSLAVLHGSAKESASLQTMGGTTGEIWLDGEEALRLADAIDSAWRERKLAIKEDVPSGQRDSLLADARPTVHFTSDGSDVHTDDLLDGSLLNYSEIEIPGFYRSAGAGRGPTVANEARARNSESYVSEVDPPRTIVAGKVIEMCKQAMCDAAVYNRKCGFAAEPTCTLHAETGEIQVAGFRRQARVDAPGITGEGTSTISLMKFSRLLDDTPMNRRIGLHVDGSLTHIALEHDLSVHLRSVEAALNPSHVHRSLDREKSKQISALIEEETNRRPNPDQGLVRFAPKYLGGIASEWSQWVPGESAARHGDDHLQRLPWRQRAAQMNTLVGIINDPSTPPDVREDVYSYLWGSLFPFIARKALDHPGAFRFSREEARQIAELAFVKCVSSGWYDSDKGTLLSYMSRAIDNEINRASGAGAIDQKPDFLRRRDRRVILKHGTLSPDRLRALEPELFDGKTELEIARIIETTHRSDRNFRPLRDVDAEAPHVDVQQESRDLTRGIEPEAFDGFLMHLPGWVQRGARLQVGLDERIQLKQEEFLTTNGTTAPTFIRRIRDLSSPEQETRRTQAFRM